ncbi:MAG: accessory factor UbiK family protein [Gammaproteobacteria bacterium]|nr:accessory factor UbiK family protein [Gammaproteobacteria bacterium]MDH5693894.1 accessory factor UbiK family protein [Gammaproteobacteria bacterium]
MLDPKTLEEITNKIMDALPADLRVLRDDLHKNMRAGVQTVLGKLDLVTREEFEAQKEVLTRTRTQLDSLAKELARLEKLMDDS